MCIILPAHMCTMCMKCPWRPEEALSPQSRSYRWLLATKWVLGNESMSSRRTISAEPSLQPPRLNFNEILDL